MTSLSGSGADSYYPIRIKNPAKLNDPANTEAVRAVVGKFIPLPPPVLAALKFGKWKADVTATGLQEWVTAMDAQKMLQTKLDINKIATRTP